LKRSRARDEGGKAPEREPKEEPEVQRRPRFALDVFPNGEALPAHPDGWSGRCAARTLEGPAKLLHRTAKMKKERKLKTAFLLNLATKKLLPLPLPKVNALIAFIFYLIIKALSGFYPPRTVRIQTGF
jgi:hypothetical protein